MQTASATISIYHEGSWKQVRVDLTIDPHGLAKQLGPKALNSKTGRSRAIFGAVIADATILGESSK